MTKFLFAVRKFIEDQGISLFATLATGAILVLIAVISWFWPDIYSVIAKNHVFDAIVVLMLIEIIIMLVEGKRDDLQFEVFQEEADVQTRVFELIKKNHIEKAYILSSGLASRRLIIAPLAKNGIRVQVLAQDPETSFDKQDIQRLHEAIDWIKIDVGEKSLKNLKLLFHLNTSSLRVVALYEAYTGICHLFLGWYIYINQNTAVRGSQNPTIYISTRSKQGKQMAQWVESVIERNRKESREVPADF